MRTVLAVARAELLKSWNLVLIPLLSLAGVVVARLSGARADDGTFLGTLLAVTPYGAGVVAAVPSAFLGMGLFAPDLRERRLSFFLTRPCTPLQLWLGRLLAALLISTAGLACAIASVGIAGEPSWWTNYPVLLAFGIIGLLLVVNAAAMLVSIGASAWFLADVVAAILFAAGLFWALTQAALGGNPRLLMRGEAAVAWVAFLAALSVAGVALIAYGRGDGRRGHRAHSIVVWSFAALVLLGLEVRRANDLARPVSSYRIAFSTPWADEGLALAGLDRGRWGAFILDPRTGAARRVPYALSSGVADPASGTVVSVAWQVDFTNPTGGFLTRRIAVWDSRERVLAKRSAPDSFGSIRAISPGGEYAVFHTITGLAVRRTRDLDQTHVRPSGTLPWVSFVDRNTVATLDADGSRARLQAFTVDGRTLFERTVPVSSSQWTGVPDRSLERLAISELGGGVTVYGPDGLSLARLSLKEAGYTTGSLWGRFGFTRDGDFVVFGRSALQVLRRGERALRSVPYSGAAGLSRGTHFLQGQLSSGELLVLTRGGASAVSLVDPASGEVRLHLPGITTLTSFRRLERSWASDDDRDLRLLANADDDILYLDPGSMRPRLLVRSTRRPD